MGDEVLACLQEARAAVKGEESLVGKCREGSIVLTHIETAILWRKEETREKPPTDENEQF